MNSLINKLQHMFIDMKADTNSEQQGIVEGTDCVDVQSECSREQEGQGRLEIRTESETGTDETGSKSNCMMGNEKSSSTTLKDENLSSIKKHDDHIT